MQLGRLHIWTGVRIVGASQHLSDYRGSMALQTCRLPYYLPYPASSLWCRVKVEWAWIFGLRYNSHWFKISMYYLLIVKPDISSALILAHVVRPDFRSIHLILILFMHALHICSLGSTSRDRNG